MEPKNQYSLAREKSYWDKRAPDYDDKISVFEAANNRSIEKIKKILNPSHKVLEIACGTGTISLGIADKVGSITAIDISSEMTNIAKAKAIQKSINNIQFEVADGYSLSYESESLDIVLLFNVLQVIKNPEVMLKEIYRVLKQDGFLLTATDCYAEKLGCKQKILLFINNIMAYFGVEKPFRQQFKKSDVHHLLTNAQFKIVEDDILHRLPLNYFVMVQK